MPNNLKFSTDHFGINDANDPYVRRLLTFSASFKEEDRASIRALIKAAPELLEALIMVNSCFAPEDNDITTQKVRAAIAKAVQS